MPTYSNGTKVVHYRIRRDDNSWVTVDDEEFFENLVKLVEVAMRICFFKFAESVTIKVNSISFPCHCFVSRHVLSVINSDLIICSYLQHYQRDADAICCQLKHAVRKMSGNIEYTVSVTDFKESKFHAVIAYDTSIKTMTALIRVLRRDRQNDSEPQTYCRAHFFTLQ